METFKVCGQSMFPTLKHGDRVLIKKPSLSQIRPRDIIVFKKDSQILCHRVIKISKDSNSRIIFYTKGDSKFKFIKKIDEKEILGKVIWIYKNDGLKSLGLKHTYVYYLIANLLSFTKEALQRIIDKPYYFPSSRILLKIFFPLKIDYLIVNTENLDEDFKSFYNFFTLNKEQYDIIYRLLAIYKKRTVGKLWILKDKNKGDILFYGPYVKVLYRGRNIGTGLVKKAFDLIQSGIKKEHIYALIMPNENILSRFFDKFSFILRKYIPMKYFPS